MTKRTVQTLGLMLLVTPLILVGCGGGDKGGGTGGAGGGAGLKYDGAISTGGTRQDAASSPDVQPPPVDTYLAIDTIVVSDTLLVPDAPPVIDVAPALDVGVIIDAPLVDAAPPSGDVPDIEAETGDASPTIDSAPVAVCTETTKFSGGDVTANRNLTKVCSPYTITDDINVNGNATLTIEPGVVLRFDPDTILSIGYNSSAKLSAMGTAVAPITFTSSNTTPGAGDWAGVQLWGNTMNGSTLSYLKLDYCGSNSDACLVGSGVKPNRVTVDHVSFSHVGAGANAIWQKDKDSNFVISNCTFNDIASTPTQQYAISVYAPSFAGIDSTNTFNGNAMVELMGDSISTDTSWKNIGTIVAVTDNLSIGGAATPTLTIAAGSTFKFATDTGISIGYSNPGKLVLAGTATSKITLTSLAGTPGPGDWDGITVWYNSSAKIAYSTISYAGSTSASSSNGAVSVVSNNDSLDIQNSTLSYSGEYGIGVPCNSTATVTNVGNTFKSNTLGNIGPGPTGLDCT
jgi:hypothetical protein